MGGGERRDRVNKHVNHARHRCSTASIAPEGGAVIKLPDSELIIQGTNMLENNAVNLFIIKNNYSEPIIADYQQTAAVECI